MRDNKKPQDLEAAQARIAELECLLAAIGAGGVESLRQPQCLRQIQEPAPEQAVQTEGSVSNATLEVAPAAVAEQALLKVLHAIQRYMPPDGVSDRETLSEIIGIVDPWPLGDVPAAVAVPDERAAFEKWLGIKPCGAAHDLAWHAWKARAALAATPAADAEHGRAHVTPNGDKWKLVDGDMRESNDGLLTYHANAYREGLVDGTQPQAAAPVVLPEHWGVCVGGRIWIGKTPEYVLKLAEHVLKFAEQEGMSPTLLYTEQQVRDLLAGVSAPAAQAAAKEGAQQG